MYDTENWCYLCGVKMISTSDGWVCPKCGTKTYLTDWITWNKRS